MGLCFHDNSRRCHGIEPPVLPRSKASALALSRFSLSIRSARRRSSSLSLCFLHLCSCLCLCLCLRLCLWCRVSSVVAGIGCGCSAPSASSFWRFAGCKNESSPSFCATTSIGSISRFLSSSRAARCSATTRWTCRAVGTNNGTPCSFALALSGCLLEPNSDFSPSALLLLLLLPWHLSRSFWCRHSLSCCRTATRSCLRACLGLFPRDSAACAANCIYHALVARIDLSCVGGLVCPHARDVLCSARVPPLVGQQKHFARSSSLTCTCCVVLCVVCPLVVWGAVCMGFTRRGTNRGSTG